MRLEFNDLLTGSSCGVFLHCSLGRLRLLMFFFSRRWVQSTWFDYWCTFQTGSGYLSIDLGDQQNEIGRCCHEIKNQCKGGWKTIDLQNLTTVYEQWRNTTMDISGIRMITGNVGISQTSYSDCGPTLNEHSVDFDMLIWLTIRIWEALMEDGREPRLRNISRPKDPLLSWWLCEKSTVWFFFFSFF